jgi:hypothetical protein
MGPRRISQSQIPLARLDRISADALPALPSPPENPTPQQSADAWQAMARAYASIVVRQHEFEKTEIDLLRSFDERLTDIERCLEAVTENHDLDPGMPTIGDRATPPP